jgi:hypothetical protein
MRKPFIAIAVAVLAGCLVLAPASSGKKGPKLVPAAVTVAASPSTVTPSTTTVTVTGNVKANSSCRKNRTVEFSYIGTGGTTALAVTAVTGPNGDFTAVLPKPTDAAPATVTLQASLDQIDRKVGSKKKGQKPKKGRKFTCLAAQGQTTLTIAP